MERINLEELKAWSESFPLFDKIISSESLPSFLLPHEIKNVVTFYAGTFDPIHLGHITCLNLCPDENIILVPDRNPQKKFSNFNISKHFEQFKNLKLNKTVAIYPGFLFLNNTNPTVNWILKIQIEKVQLLMGDDSFVSFFSWIEPEKILKKLSKIYVVSRNQNHDDLLEVKNKMLKCNEKIEIEFLGNHPYQHLSSTKLRE